MAQYYHSSIYEFDTEAWKEVIQDFCANIRDVTARCWYDSEFSMFCLKCQPDLGPRANDVLGNTISTYIARELAAADREDRRPKIQRFGERQMEDDIEVDEHSAAPAEPTSSTTFFPLQKRSPGIVRHLVALEGRSTSQVKFFKLHELGHGILERTLTAKSNRMETLISTSMSCRVVCYNASKGGRVFNGRVATPPATSTNAIDDSLFSSTPFITINAKSQRNNGTEHANTDPIQYWRFKGAPPDIRQYIEGVGETEPETPDFQPNPPKDAVQFMNQPNQQVSSLGRARVPVPSTTVVHSSSDEDSDSEESDVGSGQSSEDATIQRSFDSLLLNSEARKETKSVAELPSHPTSQAVPSSQTLGIAPAQQSSLHQIPSIPALHHSEEGVGNLAQEEDFPANNRFARVDNIGLTSNARNHAEWEHQNEHQNPASRKSRSKRSGITSRMSSHPAVPSRAPTPQSSSSYNSEPQHPQHAIPPTPESSNSFDRTSTTLRSQANASAATPGWTNRNVPCFVPSGRLIEDSAPLTQQPVATPPGYDRPDEVPADDDLSRRTAAENVTRTPVFPNQAQTLFDIDENGVSENTRPNLELHWMRMPPLVPSTPSNMGFASSPSDDDTSFNERVQSPAQGKTLKHNTMRQRAPPKSLGSASSSMNKRGGKGKPVSLPVLPMPDLFPPRKEPSKRQRKRERNKSKAQSTNEQSDESAATTTAAQETISPVSQHETQDLPSYQQPPLSHEAFEIQKMIQDISSDNDIANAELEIHFGLILLRNPSDRDFFNGVCNVEKAEEKINEAGTNLLVKFIPRLTTSDVDACYLLSLIWSGSADEKAKVEYEIHIKTVGGDSRLIMFEQTNVDGFCVLHKDTVLGTLFMHYPIRTWDAQAVLHKPEMDLALVEDVRMFVESIQTTDAPSFYAKVPSHSFTVEKIIVKRRFFRLERDAEVRVTELQHLWQQSIDSDSVNFGAFVTPRDEMVDNQRLWWEYSLHVRPIGLVSPSEVAEMMVDCISSMDNIGYENQGPWIRDEIDEPAQNAHKVPFW